MPSLIDKHEIRTLLLRDPVWSVYALGDLSPRMFAKTRWFSPDLTLVLRDFGTSILFAMGTGSLREALDHVTWPVHLQVKGDALDEIARLSAIAEERSMWRMGWKVLYDPIVRPARQRGCCRIARRAANHSIESASTSDRGGPMRLAEALPMTGNYCTRSQASFCVGAHRRSAFLTRRSCEPN